MRVDHQRILRQPFHVEHAELAQEEDVVDDGAIEPDRALTFDHAGLKIDQANLHLKQSHGPGNDERLGRGSPLPGRAQRVERIGRAAGAEHHVEGQNRRDSVRTAVGPDVAVVKREHAEVEQNAHRSGCANPG